MIYLYAQTGKEFGLDSLRRVASIYKTLEGRDDIGILVSDFRAQQAGISFGLPPAVPIEDIGLIGGILKDGDSILLDTTEELSQFIEKFKNRFSKIVRVSRECSIEPIDDEIVLPAYGRDQRFGYWQLQRLSPPAKMSKKVVLYYGDSDNDLYLLKHKEMFKGLDISLVWGEYFYVKYEDEYADSFKNIYESDEFEELLDYDIKVITASLQIASELKVTGYCVLLIDKGDIDDCQKRLISDLEIECVNIEDIETIASFVKIEHNCKDINMTTPHRNIF